MSIQTIVSKARMSQIWTLQSLKGFWDSKLYSTAGIPGSGVGKGGGAGGSIKESGGGLGRFGAAQEEGYFYNQEREKLSKLKKQLKDNEELLLKDKKDK